MKIPLFKILSLLMLEFSHVFLLAQSLSQQVWTQYAATQEPGASPERQAKLLANSLSAVLKASLSPEEQAWIDRIEAARVRLNASTQEIRFLDYGVRFPGQERLAQPIESIDLVSTISQRSSKAPFWNLLLFKLMRALQPQSGLEMGTCVGLSAAYQGAALSLNGTGSLVTIEGVRDLAAVARQTLQGLDITPVEVVHGWFKKALPTVLARTAPIDYAFIDGHHQEDATLRYFEQLLPHLSQPALLVFDDIKWSEGMRRAWATISADPRVQVSMDLGPLGLTWLDPSLPLRATLTFPLQ